MFRESLKQGRCSLIKHPYFNLNKMEYECRYFWYSGQIDKTRKKIWQEYANILIDYLKHIKYKNDNGK